MDISTLKIFVEVCKYKNITQASKSCFISRQGVSSAISRFEDELSCELFTRSASGVELTEAGKLLLPFAQRIVEMADECIFTLSTMLERDHRLEIFLAHGAIQEYAYSSIVHFTECYPSRGLKITEAEDLACESAVLERKVEIALTPGPVDETLFDSELLFSAPYVLVMNASKPITEKKYITVVDIKDTPLIIRDENSKINYNFFRVCARLGIKPSVSMQVSDSMLAFHMATIDQGIGISTQTLYERLKNPDIRAIPFEEPEMTWSLSIIKKKNAILSLQAQRFWDIVLKHRK